MLHPSYAELIKVVNGDVEEGDTPVVNSRYSIVLGEDEEGDKADEEAALAAVLASDIPSVDLQTDEVPMEELEEEE